MFTAITREISPRFADCEITHIERTPIDLDAARSQHRAYVAALRLLGGKVIELPAEPELPDSVFVEDTAVVLPEVTVITRPGADSRKPETESIVRALEPLTDLVHLSAPATLDGGDVLVLGKRIYVGLSTRSSVEAVRQLNELLGPYGYQASGAAVRGCLHLKSAVTRVDEKTLLINRNRVDAALFKGCDLIDVDPSEPDAANCLPIGSSVIFPSAFPGTAARLDRGRRRLVTVEISELAKAEGAVTCCSLILPDVSREGPAQAAA